MTNLNVYLNSWSSAVDCTLGCGTLGYLVLTAQPAVFNTHYCKEFVTPRNLGIHLVMPNPAPTAAIFSELVRTHKHEVRLFNKYHAVYSACNRVIRKLIPEKLYKSLSSRIIGFVKVASFKILTCLITEYVELEEEGVQDINWKVRRNSILRFHPENWMESTSSSCAESVFIGSDCFYGVRKHRKWGLYQDDCL